ncbi:glycoside hydrolase family 5 protein [Microbacterium sp. ASV49]|uniref:Cellulase family glycosylhydrolase n=1 Tax=Microbacterium candidum TaxID=3041922 RepID=A0ABT7N0Z3_9MICO|nr:cellulase family glycosylhydrolase [Microbacterium sp. ASV49]MDL9980368.1 cellulase family glycosylhydrolase [Microbacterium sp. ASV49]
MMLARRPLVAVGTTAALVVLQALIDPTGLLVLAGWPGGAPQAQLWWPLARYVVFLPVLFVVVWWCAVRAGARFWTMTAGVTLAILLAQAATAFAMTGDPLFAGWAASYVAAKAVPSALIVAGVTRIAAGPRTLELRTPENLCADCGRLHKLPRKARRLPLRETGIVWPYAVLLGAIAPLAAGTWWTTVVYTEWVPAPRIDHGAFAVISGMVLLAGFAYLSMRWMRRRVDGALAIWLGALVAGGMLGIVQGAVAIVVDNGFDGDIWGLMATYTFVAEGLSFGAAVGWIPAVAMWTADRIRARRAAKTPEDVETPDQAPRSAARTAVLTAVAAFAVIAVATGGVTAVRAATRPTTTALDVPAGFLRADGDMITDGSGNQVLLRGVNVNQLVDFYQPRASVPATRPLTEADFTAMASYGFNVVRLGISWSSLEPARGEYSQAYLDRIAQAVAWAKAHGIRVVIDMHQDGWSNIAATDADVCRPGTDPMWGYDGAPVWATVSDGAPRCEFQGRDISPAGDRAFEHFYFDTDGIQTALVKAWGVVADQFKGDPAVAGYDLLNEPGFGETAPVTTSQQLGRFYDRAISEIRSVGSPQMIFLEPSILWSGLGFDTGPRPGFTSDSNLVFSPHLYAESITMDRGLGLPPFVSIERQFELATRTADQYGVPLWSGEYGYWGDSADVQQRLVRFADQEDARVLGSAYWVWKQACGDPQNGIGPTGNGLIPQSCTTGDDVAPNMDLLSVLSRAYPQTAPGRVHTLHAESSNPYSTTAPWTKMTMSGSTSTRSCDLAVWIPGITKPTVTSTGVTDTALTQVSGGWRYTGCAEGKYSVTTG